MNPLGVSGVGPREGIRSPVGAEDEVAGPAVELVPPLSRAGEAHVAEGGTEFWWRFGAVEATADLVGPAGLVHGKDRRGKLSSPETGCKAWLDGDG